MNLLLHTCCAPCAVVPTQFLKEQGIDFTAFNFNPNIHPRAEQLQRAETLHTLASLAGFAVIDVAQNAQADWEDCIGQSPDRCKLCYEIRLQETARQAKLLGFDAFSTTLLISPYQDHALIKEVAEEIAAAFGMPFYYHDFRPNFREGQNQAREMGLYRQKYCGCINSLAGQGR
ncbi:MAG: epoxyqueuosine reductase QueH [Clostridia bacterium]